MDQKTRETVLKFLIDHQMNSEGYKNFPDLCSDFPKIDEKTLRSTLAILKAEELISYITVDDDTPIVIHVLPKGLAYFENKKQAKRQKRSDRRWEIAKIAISVIAGYVLKALFDFLSSH